MEREDVTVCKIKSEDNLADLFIKTLYSRVFERLPIGVKNPIHVTVALK